MTLSQAFWRLMGYPKTKDNEAEKQKAARPSFYTRSTPSNNNSGRNAGHTSSDDGSSILDFFLASRGEDRPAPEPAKTYEKSSWMPSFDFGGGGGGDYGGGGGDGGGGGGGGD